MACLAAFFRILSPFHGAASSLWRALGRPSIFSSIQVNKSTQDIWMVSLLLLLLAMTLFAVTSVASRVFCGYFCFQTSWVDLFTWIEEKIEGHPNARHKLDAAPWNGDKIRKKAAKHAIWLAISIFTGISVTVWFEDAFQYWHDLLMFNLSLLEWSVLIGFTLGTYFFAGFMREQVCLW